MIQMPRMVLALFVAFVIEIVERARAAKPRTRYLASALHASCLKQETKWSLQSPHACMNA